MSDLRGYVHSFIRPTSIIRVAVIKRFALSALCKSSVPIRPQHIWSLSLRRVHTAFNRASVLCIPLPHGVLASEAMGRSVSYHYAIL